GPDGKGPGCNSISSSGTLSSYGQVVSGSNVYSANGCGPDGKGPGCQVKPLSLPKYFSRKSSQYPRRKNCSPNEIGCN
uniref:Uncharacterized protein n=1 Tax=Magallana gigas TaxID=29159 RepID=A0A8W8MFN2_MAGGI